MQLNSIVHANNLSGRIVDFEGNSIVIDFEDGTRTLVSAQNLIPQDDGTYKISNLVDRVELSDHEEMVIPIVQEEFSIEKQKIERAKVLISKRIETWDETVYTPTTTQEVVVDHVPVGRLVEDEVPKIREEDGVLIIPIIEEIVVVEKRLFFKEEVRISKRNTTSDVAQTVTLRKEIVDIKRTEINRPIEENLSETT